MLRESPYLRHTHAVAGKGTIGSVVMVTDGGNLAFGTVSDASSIESGKALSVVTQASNGVVLQNATDIPVPGGDEDDGILFVHDGKLKYRGSRGTVTTIAEA